MRRFTTGLILLAAFSSAHGEDKAQPQVKEFADRYNERFLKRKPHIGDVVPNLKGFDEKGQPFEFKQLRGSHCVIVFGCLT